MISAPQILSEFESISLEEMDGVKLMDRTDTKFTFCFSKLNSVLEQLKQHYRVLVVEGKRASAYKTLYYDTSNHSIYNLHHNGKLNRYKIRHRTYSESNIGFLEVKFKNNKGRTIKNRIKKKDVPYAWQTDTSDFLKSKIPYAPETLIPTLWVNYSRITLVSKASKERLTIDLGLEFVRDEAKRDFSSIVIAEVKQEKKKASEFISVMKQMRIREGSISKYCMGIASTCDSVKKNNFKQKLLLINNLIYANNNLTASS